MNTTITEELENNIFDNNMENTIIDLTEKPIEYYLNLDSEGEVMVKSQFRKRAKQLGFKGNSIYLDKPSFTFQKFLNKKFKSNYNLKSNPINKDNTIKKKVEKLEKQRVKFSKESLAKKEKKLSEEISELNQLLQRRNETLQKAEIEIMTKIGEKIEEILISIKEKDKIDIIVSSKQIILYNDNMDISDKVLKRLNKELPKVKVRF